MQLTFLRPLIPQMCDISYALRSTCLLLLALCAAASHTASADDYQVLAMYQTEKKPRKPGFFLLQIDARRAVGAIVLKLPGKRKNQLSLGPFEAGRYLQLIPLPAGQYHLQSVSVPHYDLPFRNNLSDNERMAFVIEQDKTSYFAEIFVGENRSTRSVDVRVRNRLATNLSDFKQAFSQHLSRYPLIYASPLGDNYASEVLP